MRWFRQNPWDVDEDFIISQVRVWCPHGGRENFRAYVDTDKSSPMTIDKYNVVYTYRVVVGPSMDNHLVDGGAPPPSAAVTTIVKLKLLQDRLTGNHLENVVHLRSVPNGIMDLYLGLRIHILAHMILHGPTEADAGCSWYRGS